MNGLDCNAWRRTLRQRLWWALCEVDVGYWVSLAVTVALALIVLTGCAQRPMTPEEMAAAVNKCHALGLESDAYYGGPYYSVSQIQCRPKKERR